MHSRGAVVGGAVVAAPGVSVVEGVAVQVGLAAALPDMLVAGVKVALQGRVVGVSSQGIS